MRRPKGILFDLLDTLVAYAEPHVANVWADILGCPPVQVATARDRWGPDLEAGKLKPFERTRRVLGELGIRLDERLIDQLHRTELIESMRLASPFPRWRPAVVELRRRGYQLAICSNTIPPLGHVLTELYGFDGFMEQMVFSYEAGCKKPDRQMLIATCEKLHLHPTNCVLVDNEPANLDAADELGMQVVLAAMANPSAKAEGTPKRPIITSLDELLEKIPR